MMRRVRAILPLCVLLLPLVAACGGESDPPAPGPAHQPATATTTPTATVVATATPSPTASPEPEPTATATPSPTATVTPTATPTPEPHGIPFTPVTRGEPRPLPAGIALYYWTTNCIACDSGPADIRRVVFDEAAGELREDRPLAFFDSLERYPVVDFAVSDTGETLAATVCHAGWCVIDPVGGSFPSIDAEFRLWVSRDGGQSWADRGLILPETWIVHVTDEDVLLKEWNVWEMREHWELTDEEWETMLARLAPLGLGELNGLEYRFRWAVSGEEYSLPIDSNASAGWFTYAGWKDGRPVWLPGWSPWADVLWSDAETLPALSLADLDWNWSDAGPGDIVAWRVEAQGDYLLAITDEHGAVEYVYGAAESLWGLFATDDLLIRPTTLRPARETLAEVRSAKVVDLVARTIYEVEGLSLPMGYDPETDGEQKEYYHFLFARPAPAIEYTPLTWGEPRELPAGTALYLGVPLKCEGIGDILRVDVNRDSLQAERPWAFFDQGGPGYARFFGIGPRGQSLAALACERGNCDSEYDLPSDDALLALWFSKDAGSTWERWGEVPVYSYLLATTEDDAALLALPYSDEQEGPRVWWFRSGQELVFPEGLDSSYFVLWRQTGDGLTPVWPNARGTSFATASGERLPTPHEGGIAVSDWPWRLTASLPDGSLLWSRIGWNREIRARDLFVMMDEQGVILRAYSWDGPNPLELIDNVGGELYVGLTGSSACGSVRWPALIDLGTGSVHGISEPGNLLSGAHFLYTNIHAARPAPD